MRELERQFPNDVAVIGVHSGKYVAERVTERIREAAGRYEVHHPVVNDRQFRVWRSYAVRAWPTLAVVDPEGYVLGLHAGEFTADGLAPVLERMIGTFRATGALRRPHTRHTAALDAPALAPTTLRYPGKVAVDGQRGRIAVADSGHHRVLVGSLDALGRRLRVERVVGTGEPGFADGDQAAFNAPQGLAFSGDVLYVADAENHAVRAIDLANGRVRTVAGTGRQLRTQRDRDAGALSSPWDVAVVGETLYVAMAGIHQIWAVGTDGTGLRVHAGARGEDIVDGPLESALLAQPMGIVADGDAGRLYFVDAESSAVRSADLDAAAGAVRTIVGTGLFDFGDTDGVGDAVRMQHQQGLALHPSGRLLVADSYNDALKWVDPATRAATTWVRGLHEPGGLALGAGVVYVADTNAHRVAVIDEPTGAVGELEIVM